MIILVFPMFLLLSTSNAIAQDNCKEEIIDLFTINQEQIILKGNCHDGQGCHGCADETIYPGQISVSLKHNILNYFYHVERPHVWGHCPGSKWNHHNDPPFDAKIEVKFKIENGRLKILQTKEIRTDTRPSWTYTAMEKLIRVKDNTLIDSCSN